MSRGGFKENHLHRRSGPHPSILRLGATSNTVCNSCPWANLQSEQTTPSPSQIFQMSFEKSWIEKYPWSSSCPGSLGCKHHGGHRAEFSLWTGPDFDYSAVMSLFFLRCLTPDAETRPDIVEVSSMISDIMMKYVDNLSTSQLALEKKLERERRRTQRYFMEANRNAITCQQEPTLLSQVNGILSVSSGWIPIGVWGCSCLS